MTETTELVSLTRCWRALSGEIDALLNEEPFHRVFKGSANRLPHLLEGMQKVANCATVDTSEIDDIERGVYVFPEDKPIEIDLNFDFPEDKPDETKIDLNFDFNDHGKALEFLLLLHERILKAGGNLRIISALTTDKSEIESEKSEGK